MSAYVTREQIEAEIPAPQIIEALDDDRDGQEDEGMFAKVVANAQTSIDAALASQYTVPFADPVPAIAQECAFVFVCETIYRRRQVPDDRNPFFKRAEDLRKRLASLGKGETKLDVNEEKGLSANYGSGTKLAGRIS